MSTKAKRRHDPNDLPIWASLIGILPTLIVKHLGFSFGKSFLVYLAVTSCAIGIWVVDRILHELRALRGELSDFIEREHDRSYEERMRKSWD